MNVLHDLLCDIGLTVCGAYAAFGGLWLLCDRFGGIVNILDRAICKAQKRREKRRMAEMFRTENIPGTNGYRIKTR